MYKLQSQFCNRRKNTEPINEGRLSREEYKTRSKSVDASVYFEDADNSPSYFNDFTSNISRSRTGSVKYSASPATKDNPYRRLSGSERKYSSQNIDPAHQSSNRRGELLQQKK